MAWDVVSIVESVAAGLAARARADDEAQEVYSIDARDELALHPLIQQSLRAGGFGVWPEQRYPSDRTARRKSEGRRCDIVLTHDGRPLMDPDAASTLFAPADAHPLESAFWLEIKTVAQFVVGGPNGGYSGELLQPVSQDLRKMASDRLVYHAGLLLVLFTADTMTAEHDLDVWLRRTEKRGFPVAPPIQRAFGLNDRLGNGRCSVALFPVRRL